MEHTSRCGRVMTWNGNRGDVFHENGCIGALTASMYKTPPLIIQEEGEQK